MRVDESGLMVSVVAKVNTVEDRSQTSDVWGL